MNKPKITHCEICGDEYDPKELWMCSSCHKTVCDKCSNDFICATICIECFDAIMNKNKDEANEL